MILKTATAAILAIAGLLVIPVQKTSALSEHILITEVQTQSQNSKTEEFVEIANTSPSPLSVQGWRIAYLSAAGTTPTTLSTLEGAIKGSSAVLLSKVDYLTDADGFFTKGLSEAGGHIIIFDDADQEIDRVGWGGALYPKLSVAAPPDATKSLQRKIINSVYSVVGDNSKDFELAAPTPIGGGLTELEESASNCSLLTITEILADPEGSDASNEFVEVYNPTAKDVQGDGCSIETSKGSAKSLKSTIIKSKTYYAINFSNGLLNTGGSVTLKDTKNESVIVYPKTGANQSWALINNAWQYTDKPTPNQANVLVLAPEESAKTVNAAECPEGKYRSPETNRCRNIATVVSTPTPCDADQERNSQTGRCRKVAETAQSTTCLTGQERNIETNRCRKIAVVSEPKPCEVGEERNPSTNRCRKETAVKSSATQTAAQAGNKSFEWMSIAIALLGITCLAAYEYRREITNTYKRLRSRVHR